MFFNNISASAGVARLRFAKQHGWKKEGSPAQRRFCLEWDSFSAAQKHSVWFRALYSLVDLDFCRDDRIKAV